MLAWSSPGFEDRVVQWCDSAEREPSYPSLVTLPAEKYRHRDACKNQRAQDGGKDNVKFCLVHGVEMEMWLVLGG
jgi:hypothetical protein